MAWRKTYNNPNPRHIKEVLSRSFSSLSVDTIIKEHRIKKQWHDIVGEILAKKTHIEAIRGRTLYIIASSASWTNELQFHKKHIIDKINALLGNKLISDVIIKTGKIVNTSIKDTGHYKKTARELSAEEKLFIDSALPVIKDPEVLDIIKRVMGKSKSTVKP